MTTYSFNESILLLWQKWINICELIIITESLEVELSSWGANTFTSKLRKLLFVSCHVFCSRLREREGARAPEKHHPEWVKFYGNCARENSNFPYIFHADPSDSVVSGYRRSLECEGEKENIVKVLRRFSIVTETNFWLSLFSPKNGFLRFNDCRRRFRATDNKAWECEKFINSQTTQLLSFSALLSSDHVQIYEKEQKKIHDENNSKSSNQLFLLDIILSTTFKKKCIKYSVWNEMKKSRRFSPPLANGRKSWWKIFFFFVSFFFMKNVREPRAESARIHKINTDIRESEWESRSS